MAAKIDSSNFSPFDDPMVQRKQRVVAKASFMAFNSLAIRLLNELARIYPTDTVVRLLSKEMEKIVADKSKYKVGALVFFRDIRAEVVKEDGTRCQFADLLAAHSADAFKDPIPVKILQEAGISAKWAKMEPELQAAMWEYIDRLVNLSAQAVFSSSKAKEEMNALSRAVMTAAMVGKGNSPQELLSNPNVQAAAGNFVSTVK